MPVFTQVLVSALAVGVVNAFPQPKARADAPADNTALIADLITAPTQIKRLKKVLTDANGNLLTGAELVKATVFDFEANSFQVVGANGGRVGGANIETFPLLVNSGLTINAGTLGPCGVGAPHVHPRASEFFYVTEGEVSFAFDTELGLANGPVTNPRVNGKLTKNTGTLFPQGAIHWQVNDGPDCKPASIVVALSSTDPGTTTVLNMPAGAGVNKTNVPRQIEGVDVEALFPLLPPQLVEMTKKCLARCNVAKA